MTDLAPYHPVKVFLVGWACGVAAHVLVLWATEGKTGADLLVPSVSRGWGLALGLTLGCVWMRAQRGKED